MLSSRASTRLCAPKQAAHLARAAAALHNTTTTTSFAGLRITAASFQQHQQHVTPSTSRSFSTTRATQLRDFFPAKETEHIRLTAPAWPHPGYTEQQMHDIVPDHRAPRTVGDWAAWKFVRLARWFMDRATGLGSEQQVDKKNPTTSLVADKPLTEAQWLVRFIFLESIAGGEFFFFFFFLPPFLTGGLPRKLGE